MADSLKTFFFLGRPFSPLYSGVMKVRETLYKRKLLRSHSLPVPVISIGNLVMGGTGKTPVVRHIAELLRDYGYSPAVVSRGYKSKSHKKINVVSDGKSIKIKQLEAGDEPFMLARMLKDIPVLTGSRRIYPCRFAIDNFKSNVLILDDGFQHLPVKRNLDIVLFDGSTLAGNSRVFPGGELREPVSALERCDVILITGITNANEPRTGKFKLLLQKKYPRISVFPSRHNTCQLWCPENSAMSKNLTAPHYAFCGIANPLRFKDSLERFKIILSGFETFKDHVMYSQSLISSICQKAKKTGAEYMITTEKDYVKLSEFSIDLPLVVFKIKHQADKKFDDFIIKSLRNAEE